VRQPAIFRDGLVAEQRRDVAAVMHNMQDKNHIVFLNSMDDDTVVSRETSQAGSQILVTLSP
jgi:hypothetical protein